MARIACDIDDTLYSFTDEAREVLSEMVDEDERYHEQLKNALYANWDQWRTPYELCGFDENRDSLWLEVIRRCHDDERILAQTPFPGAVETLQDLDKEGHQFVYISNRATETYEATFQWLEEQGFPTDPLKHELVITSGPKGPYVEQCQYMIDDRARNVLDFIYDYEWYEKTRYRIPLRERKAFVRVAGYNNGLTDVKRLYLGHTWTALRRYMIREGLLLENKLVTR